MLQDLRFGFRMLRRSPGFSTLAVLCLTLGIGANAAVFSWIEGVLLRPYPMVANAGRLLVVSGTAPGASKGTELSWPDFQDLQRRTTLFDAFIAEKIVGTTLSVGGDRADRTTGSVVSANYFDAMGVHPILGRGFEPDENVDRNAHPVVVISYQLWQDRFRGDPGVVGRTQMLNGVPHTIVGVAPEGFFGTFVGYNFQFWVPLSMQETFEPGGYKLEDRGARWIEGFVRLRPGVTRAQAQAKISAAAARLQAEYPSTNRARGVQLLPLWESPFNPMEVLFPTLGIALVVVGSVLLIACANVGNLLLLKSFGRRREMSIRLAVGAGRARLVRQLLTEGVILAAFAAVGGLLVAVWCRNGLVLLFPPRGGTAMRLPAELDWRVLAVSVGVCLVATLLFGLAPALLSSRIELAEALKSESAGVVGGRGRAWVRAGLVLVQVSLSFVLLVGAGLVIESLQHMRTTSPGFSTDGVVTTSIDLVSAGYDAPRARTFQDELLARLATVSGVRSAAFLRITPFSYRSYSSAPIAVDGYDAPPDQPPTVDYDEVRPGLLLDDRHSARVRPRVHARRRRDRRAGGGGQRDDGGAVLARRGSGRAAAGRERPRVPGRRHRQGRQVQQSLRNADAVLLRAAAADDARPRPRDPHAAQPRRDDEEPRPAGARARREPGAGRGDHHAGADRAHDFVADAGRDAARDLRRPRPGARRDRPLRRHGLCRVAEHARVRPAARARGERARICCVW